VASEGLSMTFLQYIKNFYKSRYVLPFASLVLGGEFILFRHYTHLSSLYVLGAVLLSHVTALWIAWKLESYYA